MKHWAIGWTEFAFGEYISKTTTNATNAKIASAFSYVEVPNDQWEAVEAVHTSLGFSCDDKTSTGVHICSRPDTCSSIAEFMPNFALTVSTAERVEI